jgi:hypothetical protein
MILSRCFYSAILSKPSIKSQISFYNLPIAVTDSIILISYKIANFQFSEIYGFRGEYRVLPPESGNRNTNKLYPDQYDGKNSGFREEYGGKPQFIMVVSEFRILLN